MLYDQNPEYVKQSYSSREEIELSDKIYEYIQYKNSAWRCCLRPYYVACLTAWIPLYFDVSRFTMLKYKYLNTWDKFQDVDVNRIEENKIFFSKVYDELVNVD